MKRRPPSVPSNPRRRSLVAAAVIAALAAPTAGYAQSADATLRGRAAANADVTARNVATGAVRRTKADADGSYALVGLPPGTYKVDAGAGTERVVTLTVASTATLDLQAASTLPTGSLEDVTVNAARLREVRTSEVGTTVSLQQIETVPQLTRNFLEFADIVPGVVFNVDAKGKTSIRGGAQNDNSVNVYIDGVGQKGYVRSGLSGQTDNTQGNPFPQLAIGEYKVITSNYKAEYDQISSAAITADTKSGTNEFTGEVFATYTEDGWRARTPGEVAADKKTPSKTKEYGLVIGGPIVQDKMHFLVTYEGKRYTSPITVSLDHSPPAAVAAALPTGVTAQLGPATLPFDEDLVFGKIDWEPTDVDRLVLSVKTRDEKGLGDQAGVGTAASASIETKNTDHRVDFRWQRSGERWFNEAVVTWEDAFFKPKVKNAGTNGAVYTFNDGTNDQNMITVDGSDPRAGQDKGQRGWSVGDTLTFTNLAWHGDHTVKGGLKFKQVDLTAQDAVVNNPVFYYDVSSAGTAAIPYRAIFAQPVAGFDPKVVSKDKQLGIYLQDDWVVNEHLTLNVGARWDIEWNPSYLDFKTPQALIDALNTEISPGLTYGQSLGLSSDPATKLNINDYLSNGSNRSAYKGEFQPRLGFSWDVNGDQKHVFFGGAGRAYDRDLYDYLQLEQTKFALGQADIRFNTPDHACTVNNSSCFDWNPNFLNGIQNLQALLGSAAVGEVDVITNKLKVPYSDQFSLGMRNRLGDWNTSASVVRIHSKDGFAFTLGNRRPDGSFWGPVPWGGPAQPWLFPPPGLSGNLIIGNNGIETTSTQLLLSADKPFTRESGWGTTLAYTYTSATQNRDINEHYSFDEVTIGQYPFITSNAAAKHRFVGTASIGVPWGVTVGAKLTIASPIPHNAITCLGGGQAFPTGSPCTAVAYTAPGLGFRSLDVQVSKDFDIKGYSTVYVRLDLINVTNARNFVDYSDHTGANGLIDGGRYNETGNISGVPRTLRMTFGARF
jgi:outer membrane receptor protein involved in Fe transport